MEMNFCRRCGSTVSSQDNGTSYTCTNNHTLFVNSAPTASIILVNQAGNLLLSKRGIEPGKGQLDAFGGFIDNLETTEDAAVRELAEETGLTPEQYEPLQYLSSGAGSYLFDGETRSVLTLCYWARLKPGVTLVASDDVAEIVEMSPDEFKLDELWNEDIKHGYRDLIATLSKSTGIISL